MAKHIAVFLLMLIATAGGAAGIWWWITIGSIPVPVRFCDDNIREILKSPTSYQRDSYLIGEEAQDFDINKFIEAEAAASKFPQKLTEDEIWKHVSVYRSLYGNGYRIIRVTIEFDAKNPMGALLRHTGICTWVKLRKEGPITWENLMRKGRLLFGPQDDRLSPRLRAERL